MALDANAVVHFDQLVRIFVDTDVDTHFIVSIARTSTVAELREVVKVTHRHCYPGKGQVDIGQLAVPGGDYGYHLADFLRIGQVYDKDEGKVLAEVRSCDPALEEGVYRMPALSLTPKKVPLLAPQQFVGEPGALLAEELKEPKPQKEEFDGDANYLLCSQEPQKEEFGAALFDRGTEISLSAVDGKVASLNPEICVAEPDKISEGATASLTLKKGVGRKRNASVSNERPSKSRRLTEPAPSGRTSEENCRLEVRKAIERAKGDNIVKDVNEPTGGSLSHVDRSGDLDSNLLSSSASKRRKKKLVRNLDLTISENGSEAEKGVLPAVEDKEAMCDAKDGEKEDNGLGIGSGVEASGIFGLEVGREEKSDALLEGPGVSKKKTTKKRGPKPERKLSKRKKKPTKAEVTPVMSASLNHEAKESGRDHERENGQYTFVTSALVDPGHQLGATATSPNHSQQKQDLNEKQEQDLNQEQKQELNQEQKPERKRTKKKDKKRESTVVSASLNHEAKESGRENEQENGQCTYVTSALVDPGHQLGATATSPNHSQQKQDLNEKQEQDLSQEQKQELNQEQKPERKRTNKKKKEKRRESTPVVSPGLNHEAKESGRENEQENGQCTYVTSALVDPGHQLGATATGPNHSQQKQDLNPEQEREPNQEQKQELNQEQKPERKRTNKKKEKKRESNPVVSASLNHEAKGADRRHEQENGQCTYLTSPVLDPGHQLGATATSPNQSQHVNNNEEVANNAVKRVEKKSRGKKLKKKGSTVAAAIVSVDACIQKGSQDSGKPLVLNLLKGEASDNQTPRREAQVLNETPGEGMIQNGAELAKMDDTMVSPKINLLSDFNDVETSSYHKGGTGASPHSQAAKVGSVESQETPSSSKKAGRGAPSQSRHTGISEDVTDGEGRDTKTSENQSFQASEKAQQHSEGINKGSEMSAAQMGYSEANSGYVIASPGKADHLSIERLECEPGHIDHFQVAKPDKVAHSITCTGESSAESVPGSSDQAEVGSQLDVSRKEDRILKASHMSPTPSSARSLEKHASTSPKRADGGEVNLKNDSLQFFSQDQSFQVAPTQVEKALSGNTTEDSSDESDTNPDDELKKQKADKLGISDKGIGESQESSAESGGLATTGYRGNPPLTTRTPVPLGNFPVSGMTGSGGIKSSQTFKRRASGITAEIEAKFAHFIESQDGLDELMGITLGQRKRSMPIEPSTQAGSLATAPSSPLDVALNTQESARNSSMTLPGTVVGLERYQAVDLAPASQNSTGKLLAPQFKVPRPVPVAKILAAGQGGFSSAATVVQPSGKEVPKTAVKEVPKTAVKELRLKRKDSFKQADKKKESKSLLEKHNDASPVSVRETSKETLMDDQDAAEGKQTSAGNYDLLYTPEALKDDLNAATDRKISVEKTREERKRAEEIRQDSQFMIVNSTDHISEQDREDKKLGSNDETKGLSCINEDAPNVTGKKPKERKKNGESVEASLVGSQETSAFDMSAKKKRKASDTIGGKEKKKRKVDAKEVDIFPETSMDRSARETEELYLKLENANRDLWLQKEKIENGDSPTVNGIEAAEGEDVAQRWQEGGKAQMDDADNNNKVKVISDTSVPGGNAADSHLSPDLCAGTTEASDREDGGFLSQDEKAGASHQEVQENDVYDFVSEDEAPMRSVSKLLQKSGRKEDKAKRLEDVASRAVQRVLEDEMLHVQGSNSALGKNSRKVAKPVNWTTRMQGSPSALAISLLGGTIPFDAINPTQFNSSPHIIAKSAGEVSGRGAKVESAPKAPKPRAPPKAPKPVTPKAPKAPKAPKDPSLIIPEMCPMGCGKVYQGRTSSYYLHKRACDGTPAK